MAFRYLLHLHQSSSRRQEFLAGGSAQRSGKPAHTPSAGRAFPDGRAGPSNVHVQHRRRGGRAPV